MTYRSDHLFIKFRDLDGFRDANYTQTLLRYAYSKSLQTIYPFRLDKDPENGYVVLYLGALKVFANHSLCYFNEGCETVFGAIYAQLQLLEDQIIKQLVPPTIMQYEILQEQRKRKSDDEINLARTELNKLGILPKRG